MTEWIHKIILWYVRRSNGSFGIWAIPYQAKTKKKRRYHVVLMTDTQFNDLNMNTTWQRGTNL